MSENRKPDGVFVPVGDLALDLPDVLVPARRRQARHFTKLDQIDQLVAARDADPELGFMARLLALCSLPRSNPGNRLQYVRRNGPYALVMSAGGLNKLPYGTLQRLLLAWASTCICAAQALVAAPVPPVRIEPGQVEQQEHRERLPHGLSARVEENNRCVA